MLKPAIEAKAGNFVSVTTGQFGDPEPIGFCTRGLPLKV